MEFNELVVILIFRLTESKTERIILGIPRIVLIFFTEFYSVQ